MEILQYIILAIIFLGGTIFISSGCAALVTYYEDLRVNNSKVIINKYVLIISTILIFCMLFGFIILYRDNIRSQKNKSKCPQYQQITEPIYKQIK